MSNTLFDKYFKKVAICLIVISFFFIFKNYIIALLVLIGDKIDTSQSFFNFGYTLLVLLVITFYVWLIERQYILIQKYNAIFYLILFAYFIFRTFDYDKIVFLPVNSQAKYLDIIFFFGLLHSLLLLVKYENIKNQNSTKNVDQFFVEDQPYIDGIIDNELTLQKLIDTLKGFKPDSSFNIGINAVWGYGKSTFLKRFEIEYEKRQLDPIMFWYFVWKNKGANAIIENFFDELKLNLKPYSNEFSFLIDDYVDAILCLSNTEISRLIESGKSLFDGNSTLESYHVKLGKAIKQIDKQVIVLLDDLDRLERDEALITLKLMRTLSDFNNIIFIAGYDRQHLVDTINFEKKNYIDKVFNVEINLLPFEETKMYDEIINKVEETFSDKKIIDGFKNLFSKTINNNITKNEVTTLLSKDNSCTNFKLQYSHFIKTYRDLKRFINEFKFSISLVGSPDNIIIDEYILLKLCTHKYRNLYTNVLNDLDDYLEKGTIEDINSSIKHAELEDIYTYTKTSKEKLFKILDDWYSEKDKEIINAVFCRLFSEKNTVYYNESQNCIAKILYTNIYIRNNVLAANITIEELNQLFREHKLYTIVEKINSLSSQSSTRLRNEIKLFIFKVKIDNRYKFIDVLKTINNSFNNYNNEDNKRVLQIIGIAFKNVYKNNIRSFSDDFDKLILTSSIGYLDLILKELNINMKRKERSLVYGSSEIVNYGDNILNSNDLIKKLLFKKLKCVIQEKNSIEQIFKIYHLYTAVITHDRKIIRSMESNQTIRENIMIRFEEYYWSGLFDFVSDGTPKAFEEQTHYKPNDYLCQIFCNTTTLERLLNDPTNQNLFNQFKEEGWNNYYEYIKSINKLANISVEYTMNRLNRIKLLMNLFIENRYKELSYQQYSSIWDIEMLDNNERFNIND